MKKTLVAVAALAAISGAMAEATISGAIAFGYDSITNSAAGITQTTKTFGDAPGNSSLNFNMSEDIGGGLKAEGQIGFLPTIDGGGNGAASTFSAAGNTTGYQSFIALSGDFGRIQGGRFADSQALVQFNHDVVNAWGYNPTNGLAAQFGNFFAPNQLKYTTPSIFSGLTLSATKGLGETAGSRVGESTSFAAGFAQGGFSADIAVTKIAASVAIDTTITALGASYDFGMAKLTGIMTEHQVENQTSTTASSVGVAVPMGAFTFAAQAGTSDNFAVSNLVAPTAVKQTSVDWRVSYALSKRTNIHGVFSTLDGNNGNATAANAAVNGDSRKLSRVFISHSF